MDKHPNGRLIVSIANEIRADVVATFTKRAEESKLSFISWYEVTGKKHRVPANVTATRIAECIRKCDLDQSRIEAFYDALVSAWVEGHKIWDGVKIASEKSGLHVETAVPIVQEIASRMMSLSEEREGTWARK